MTKGLAIPDCLNPGRDWEDLNLIIIKVGLLLVQFYSRFQTCLISSSSVPVFVLLSSEICLSLAIFPCLSDSLELANPPRQNTPPEDVHTSLGFLSKITVPQFFSLGHSQCFHLGSFAFNNCLGVIVLTGGGLIKLPISLCKTQKIRWLFSAELSSRWVFKNL